MKSVTDPWDDTMPVVARPDLTRLAALLCERDYTQHAREHILAYARDLGSLEGCEYLEPVDRADADALLEDAWPAVAPTSHAWDEDVWNGKASRWTIAPGGLVPPELEPDASGHSEEDEAFVAAWSAAREAELEASAVVMPEPEVFPIDF